jgi:ATP-dependent DNA helicase RecG
MLKTEDGFKIAEADFLLRGPGKISGLKQHGAAGFKVADIFRDSELLKYAKEDAECLVADPLTFSKDSKFKEKLDVILKDNFNSLSKA